MDKIRQTIKDIKDLKIQGATAIARASLEALKELKAGQLEEAVERLANARPTEPLTRNCLAYVLWQVKRGEKTLETINLMLARLSDIEGEIVKNGVGVIKPAMKILTHCHSQVVESLLKSAHLRGVDFFVYVTETRPLFQGRITAENLTKAGIKTTMITDSAAPYTLSHLDEVDINLVLLGADAIAWDGSCVNKIGSFAISLAAKEARIPLYIAATLLKFAPETKTGKLIVIEERSPLEIWATPPKNSRITSPAFDLIPQDKITGLITEFGVIQPERVKKTIEKNHAWLMGSQVKRPELKPKKFSYLHLGEKFDSQEHIVATYKVQSQEPLVKAAEEIAAESSIGTWTKITHQTKDRFRQLSAKIFEADEKAKRVKIAYPLELFEPGNIPQLLSSVAGNIFGMKKVANLRLEDLQLPEKYVQSFPGPGVGLEGIRECLGVGSRPILASIIKPKIGLSAKEHVEITRQLFQAGIDLVKDDENLTSPLFNPFDKRLAGVMRVIGSLNKSKLYAFNITAGCHLMLNRAQTAQEAGSRCVMVDVLTIGFAALQALRRKFPSLIIHGHRAMHAALTRNKKHGISMLVLAKIARLAGIDQLHTGTIIGKMEGEKEEVLEINKFLRSKWYGLKPVLPIASGGLYPGLIPNLIEILGKEMIFAFGGGIHGHPGGPEAGAKAVVQAVEAVQKGIALKEYARDKKELKAALALWTES